MTSFIVIIVLALIGGLVVKLADTLIDEENTYSLNWQYIAAAAYGFVIGAIAISSGEAATLCLAVIIAMVAFGKIKYAHWLAIGIIGLLLVFKGIPVIDSTLFALFFVFAIVDEMMNDRYDKAIKTGEQLGRIKAFLFEERPTLVIVCLAVSLLTGNWIYFGIIFAFQIGYFVAEKIPFP